MSHIVLSSVPCYAPPWPDTFLIRAALQLSCAGSRFGGHAQNRAFWRAPEMDCKDAWEQPIAHAKAPPLSTVGVRWAGAEGASPTRRHANPGYVLFAFGLRCPRARAFEASFDCPCAPV
eukprot:10280664-Alexandrium_andersonii.AAC.1